MKTIWKYEIPIQDRFYLQMPEGARVLSVQVQRGIPSLWATVDSSARNTIHDFELRGTGHALGEVGDYLCTFQMHDGSLVWHLFNGPSASSSQDPA